MKKSVVGFLAVLFLMASLCDLRAAARNISNQGMDYSISEEALSKWSCGVYWDQWKHNVRLFEEYNSRMLESSKIMAFAGYDVLPWLTAFATVGRSYPELQTYSSDHRVAYGAGLQLNILDHEVPDPTLIEDKIRVNGGIEYVRNSGQWENLYGGDDLDWGEVFGSLTVGIVNDLVGNILFIPETITAFCGPIFSYLDSGDIDGIGKTEVGFTGGIDVVYTERVTLTAQYNKFDEGGFSAGLTVRF